MPGLCGIALLCIGAGIWRQPPLRLPVAVLQLLGYLMSAAVLGLVIVEMMNFSSQALTGWQNAPTACTLALAVVLVAWAIEWKGLVATTDRRTFVAACAIVFTLTGGFCYVLLPGGSYLFCIPAIVASVLFGFYTERIAPASFGALFAILVVLLVSDHRGSLHALGLNAAPFLGLSIGLFVLPLVPLLPAPSNKLRGLALAPLAVALALIVSTAPSSGTNPRS